MRYWNNGNTAIYRELGALLTLDSPDGNGIYLISELGRVSMAKTSLMEIVRTLD